MTVKTSAWLVLRRCLKRKAITASDPAKIATRELQDSDRQLWSSCVILFGQRTYLECRAIQAHPKLVVVGGSKDESQVPGCSRL
jgi:hypothetical protein